MVIPLLLRTTSRRAAVLSKNFIRAGSTIRSFHFASSEYASCFVNIPQPDTAPIRKSAVDYLDSFDPKIWYDQPIVSLLKGKELTGGPVVDTVNALGEVNGKQVNATPEQVAQLKEHIKTYQSKYKDLRAPIRAVEQRLLSTEFSGFLIGNQCVDYQKQDGVTEIEESIMANTVERRLNDLLLQSEIEGTLSINRKPIYVSAVSNFTNFLDLFRKTMRSIEVGVPCVILGRSNTAQHSYRWAKLLCDLLKEEDPTIDDGMITFLACELSDIISITQGCKENTGNLYTTCSRELAAEITSTYPDTIASTGGPNTLICASTTDPKDIPKVYDAIRISAAIESSGQCTALRHAVLPCATADDELKSMFDSLQEIKTAPEAMKQSVFAGVFAGHKGTNPPDSKYPDYKKSEKTDAYYKINDINNLPAPGINEFWRKVVVDFSKIDINASNTEGIDKLAAWLRENQPISMGVNGPRKDAIALGLQLWEKTGLVVNTIGSTDDPKMSPALSCQARPQEGECFGEFPPRSDMKKFSKYPVVVPSSNPSYDASYTMNYLKSKSRSDNPSYLKDINEMLAEVKDTAVRGYCNELIEYLRDVSKLNPKQGFGTVRTALFGLQRPPLGTKSVIHCKADTTFDDVAPILLLFQSTNARDQVEVSVDPQNKAVAAICKKFKVPIVTETEPDLEQRKSQDVNIFHAIKAEKMNNFPMAGNFVSLYLPLGHIKSTMSNDDEFVLQARLSKKWLNSLF